MAVSFHDKFQRTIAVITFIFIAIRLYIRCWIRWRFPSLSDFFVMAAWLMYFIPVIVDEVIAPHLDLENNADDITWYLKWVYYWFFQYFSIYYAIKASLLLFYNEWIPRSLNRLWIANRVLMVICGICYAYTACVHLLACQPVSSNWDLEGKICQPGKIFWVFVSSSTLHLFTDLLIYILPVFVLYYMSAVTTRKKLGAAFMFMLGVVSIIFSALRFGLSLYARFHPNGVVNLSVIYVSQNLDESAGVFVVCCPSLKLFIARCYKYWRGVYYRMRGKPMHTDLELSSLKNSGGRAEKGQAGSVTDSTVAMTSNIPSPARADGRGFDEYFSTKSPVSIKSPMAATTWPGTLPRRHYQEAFDSPERQLRVSEQELVERIQSYNLRISR